MKAGIFVVVVFIYMVSIVSKSWQFYV